MVNVSQVYLPMYLEDTLGLNKVCSYEGVATYFASYSWWTIQFPIQMHPVVQRFLNFLSFDQFPKCSRHVPLPGYELICFGSLLNEFHNLGTQPLKALSPNISADLKDLGDLYVTKACITNAGACPLII
jgi:hypothetical protein